MNLGNIARVVTVAAACLAAAGSATSSSNSSPGVQPQNANMSPPPPQDMDPSRSLGLWRSNFGAVKIEADDSRGGIAAGAVQGVWVYQRQGQEVIGYFNGTLRGNVLDFRWQEPGGAGGPPLVGAGYLVFNQNGAQYSGRWWSDKRDRVGDWHGSRQAGAQQAQPPQYGTAGGSQYGGQPAPYGPAQPSPYGQPQQPQQPSPYPPSQPSPPSPYGQPQQPAPQQPAPQQPYYPSQPQPYYPPPR